MSTMKITAYADKVSVAPGEDIKFMVNCHAREISRRHRQTDLRRYESRRPGIQRESV